MWALYMCICVNDCVKHSLNISPNEITWPYLTSCDLMWPHLASSDLIWSYLLPSDHTWSHMTQLNPTWSHLSGILIFLCLIHKISEPSTIPSWRKVKSSDEERSEITQLIVMTMFRMQQHKAQFGAILSFIFTLKKAPKLDLIHFKTWSMTVQTQEARAPSAPAEFIQCST